MSQQSWDARGLAAHLLLDRAEVSLFKMNNLNWRNLGLAVVVVLCSTMVGPLQLSASTITFTTSGFDTFNSPPVPDPLGASATFTVLNGNLVITLSNTAGSKATSNSSILTGLFFDLGSNVTVSPVSASASSYFGTPAPTNTELGGDWEYLGGLSGDPGAATSGIGASGLGTFGSGNFGSPSNPVGAV